MSSKGTTKCILDKTLGMFRVVKAKGKSLCSGGYGVAHTTRRSLQPTVTTTTTTTTPKSDTTASTTATVDDSTGTGKQDAFVTHDYLFIEEVLFLHERGLLDAYDGLLYKCNDDPEHEACETKNPSLGPEPLVDIDLNYGKLMTTRDIYQIMLHEWKVPLSVYLTYSHLRSQTFIVLRHTQHRIGIIRRLGQQKLQSVGHGSRDVKRKRKVVEDEIIQEDDQSQSKISKNDTIICSREEYKHECNGSESVNNHHHGNTLTIDECERSQDKNTKQKSLSMLKKDLREDSFHAPIPRLILMQCSRKAHDGNFLPINNRFEENVDDFIAFDVYQPNSNFKKTMPGMPDFLVAIVPFSESTNFSLLQRIVQHCGDIPLKIAAVSDAGTVVMFGISDLGVPCIHSSLDDANNHT